MLTFSAAAFEEFRAIARNILLSSGLNINQTNTADLKGVTVSVIGSKEWKGKDFCNKLL